MVDRIKKILERNYFLNPFVRESCLASNLCEYHIATTQPVSQDVQDQIRAEVGKQAYAVRFHVRPEFEVVKLKPGEPVTVAQMHMYGGQLRPIRLLILPHGSVSDEPSYAWELVDEDGRVYVAQITDKMLREGFRVAQLAVPGEH